MLERLWLRSHAGAWNDWGELLFLVLPMICGGAIGVSIKITVIDGEAKKGSAMG